MLAALEWCVGLLWDAISWCCWQPWSVVSVCPESLIYIQKEEATADTKAGNRKERTKIGHKGGDVAVKSTIGQ